MPIYELLQCGPAVVLLFLGEASKILIHSPLLQSFEIATDLLIEQEEGRMEVSDFPFDKDAGFGSNPQDWEHQGLKAGIMLLTAY